MHCTVFVANKNPEKSQTLFTNGCCEKHYLQFNG